MKNQINKMAIAIKVLILVQLFVFSECRKKEEVNPDPIVQEDTTMVYHQANNPTIQYIGRIDFTNPLKPNFSYPGVSIKAKFEGKAIDVVIKDYGAGGATNTNYFNIIIDGSLYKVLKVNSTDTVYNAARDLSDAEHTIEVFKRTEATVGKSAFWGFQLRKDKHLLALPSQPNRKVEFIGDSFTCGYGNEASYSSGTNTGFHSVNENNYSAWGAIVCRDLNAQYMCTAYSGRGLYRNNTGSTSGTMPSVYDRIHPDAAYPTWNTNNYIPDLVVIHIGTNDFFPEQWATPSMVDSAVFVNTYINLVTTLRGYYPSAKIICVVPNSLSNWWPVNFRSLDRIRSYTNTVVSKMNTGGDANVLSFELTTQSPPYGEDWHPSNATHQSMADQIEPFIRSKMGW